MEEKFYTTEQISEILGIHQKTVLRYIKEQRISAVKMGGQWRISETELKNFTGQKQKEIMVSSITDVYPKSKEDSIRITNTLVAVMNAGESHSSLKTLFYEDEMKLRIMLWGTIDFTKKFLDIIESLT
ncbi:MAG TPA: helix-turn-helix domain-containing protein [Tepiditoga sp.]|nr:helix-turn-helix domain-containing protein [Thermotogota bacterium]HOO75374.1 helix-turn-helix domain-containing protein [Tepiditoga sp.]